MTREARDAPQFYLTAPSACPYLPGQQERKIFTHLVGKRAAGAQRPPHPDRLPPLADDRLPAGVRELPRLRVGQGAGRRFSSLRQPAPRDAGQRRPSRRLCRAEADQRALRALPLLPRQPASARRHGGHVVARLRHDGRGHPYRHRPHRISPARAAERRAGLRSAPRGLPHRPPRRRPVAGLFVLRSRRRRAGRSAVSSFSTTSRRRAASACPTSISAIGSRARRRWATRRAYLPQERLGLHGWTRVER